jgi:hypothetical protein
MGVWLLKCGMGGDKHAKCFVLYYLDSAFVPYACSWRMQGGTILLEVQHEFCKLSEVWLCLDSYLGILNWWQQCRAMSPTASHGLQGKRWVERLLWDEYNVLTFEERLEAALDLMHLALDMPTVRAMLDKRSDEVERAKKHMRDAAKAERHQRQLELAQRAKQDAEEAAVRVAALRAKMAAAEMGTGMEAFSCTFVLHVVCARAMCVSDFCTCRNPGMLPAPTAVRPRFVSSVCPGSFTS